MDVSSLPAGLLSKIRDRFEADAKVRRLRVQQQMFQRSGKYREALSLAQDLEVLFNNVVYEYMSNAESEVSRVDISAIDMPLERKEEMVKLLLVCFMCADMIESAVMDMDDILHKYDKDLNMEMFNDMRQVMDMCKSKLQYLQENSGYMSDLVWGDRCDDMYSMLKSKAGSIMNKRKTDKNYGSNSEKLKK
jgi:hypothetical protein